MYKVPTVAVIIDDKWITARQGYLDGCQGESSQGAITGLQTGGLTKV